MTVVVVDVGAMDHGTERSMDKLVHRFDPDVLYAIDPQFASATVVTSGKRRTFYDTRAAWTHSHGLWMTKGTLSNATVMIGAGHWDDLDAVTVESFDFAAWLATVVADTLVVKLDCEGAEYPLLDAIVRDGIDSRIDLLLVEWHILPDRAADRIRLTDALRCPMEYWE